MHARRTLTAVIGVGALVLPLFVVAYGGVVQASPPSPRIWYVAQSGTASFGSGTSCAAPDVVGSDDTAVRTALAAVMDDDTVAICDGVYTITRTLNVDDSIAIQGQSTLGTVLDGGDVAQIMRLEDSAIDDTTGVPEVSVVIQDLTFRNGSTGPNGTDACNTQSQCGGAIYAEDESNLIVRRSYFLNNSASFIGGAIAMHGEGNYTGGDIRIYDSTFESNTSDIDGGGIGVAFNFSPGLTVVNSTFVDNHAVGRAGGAIGQAFAVGTISSSTFVNNRSPEGTALAGPFTVTGSLFAQEPGIPGDLCNAGTFSGSVATTANCGTSTVVTYPSLNLRGLGMWGGPTPTVGIGRGSTAYRANTGPCQTTDQRGDPRSAPPCYAGAYERQGPADEETAPPPVPPSAPLDVAATAEDALSRVSWAPPGSMGSYSVTHYLVTSSPDGRICLTSSLTCEVAGLSNGKVYTFTVKALTGAGWSESSAPSNAVTPTRRVQPSILISGMREGNRLVVTGRAMGMDSATIVSPFVARSTGDFEAGASVALGVDGSLAWSRRASKAVIWRVYMATVDRRSNTVTIR